jgi:hypothetical protein
MAMNVAWAVADRNYLFHRHFPQASDHLLNFALGLGAIFGILAVIVGAAFTARYGRRGSVSVSAELNRSPQLCAIVVRPSVKAVGVFRIRFSFTRVTVETVRYDERGKYLSSGAPVVLENVFSDSFVEGGEELLTTVFLPVAEPDAATLGWFARIEVKAGPRFLRGRLSKWPGASSSYWYDTVFVSIESLGS